MVASGSSQSTTSVASRTERTHACTTEDDVSTSASRSASPCGRNASCGGICPCCAQLSTRISASRPVSGNTFFKPSRTTLLAQPQAPEWNARAQTSCARSCKANTLATASAEATADMRGIAWTAHAEEPRIRNSVRGSTDRMQSATWIAPANLGASALRQSSQVVSTAQAS